MASATKSTWKGRLGRLLVRWGAALQGPPAAAGSAKPAIRRARPPKAPRAQTALSEPPRHPAAACPATREPLSVQKAVLERDLPVLKREAADALAALGAAHALVTSARLAQVQEVREMVERGEVEGEALVSLAADYQGWQNDQVRLFDALALVMRMKVPAGNVLEQVDPGLHEQARSHLESLSLEYQRRLLIDRFPAS
jgi:hypothetical protein